MAQLPCIVLVYHGPLLSHLGAVHHLLLQLCTWILLVWCLEQVHDIIPNAGEKRRWIPWYNPWKKKHPTNISKFRNLEIVPSSPDAPFQAPTSGYLFPLDFCEIAREFSSFLEPTEQQKRWTLTCHPLKYGLISRDLYFMAYCNPQKCNWVVFVSLIYSIHNQGPQLVIA